MRGSITPHNGEKQGGSDVCRKGMYKDRCRIQVRVKVTIVKRRKRERGCRSYSSAQVVQFVQVIWNPPLKSKTHRLSCAGEDIPFSLPLERSLICANLVFLSLYHVQISICLWPDNGVFIDECEHFRTSGGV